MMGNLKLSTSSQCIKYLMFIFNLLFVITGIILLSIGSVIHGVYYDYDHFLDDRFLSVPSLLIAIGSLIFFIAFFGCCGAIKENYCMIITFATLMVLIFILELSAGISGYVLRGRASEVIKDKMLASMSKYNESKEIQKVWDAMQIDFKCCGTEGPKDWLSKINTINGVPRTCCEMRGGAVGESFCGVTNSTDKLYEDGCKNVLAKFIQGHAVQLGGAGLGIAFVQALGIWFSIYLARQIKRNYHNM